MADPTFRPALATSLLALLLCSCERELPPPHPRNVVLITIDTLRSDHLGAYGYGRRTSPNIDRLASQGVLFKNAYSQAGWTTPSMATLMTGLYPHQHGATRFDTPIRPMTFTLAEQLETAGYATHAYVSHSLVGRAYGFNRGFDSFDTAVLRRGHPGEITTSEELTDRAIRGVQNVNEPYFLWVHYMDPHQEFIGHDQFEFGDLSADLYDSEIAHNDEQVGRLLAALGERGLLDRSVVVLTADHGEELGEHGVTGHFTLHDEVLRIPLIIQASTLRPRTMDLRVSQLDILRTVLSLVGLSPQPGAQGRDILAASLPATPIFAERIQPNAYRQRSVVSGDLKLIYIDENPNPAASASDFEYDTLAKLETGLRLFDLDADPGETTDLFDQRRSEAMALLALLKAQFGEVDLPEGTIEITPQREAELRSLGYIE